MHMDQARVRFSSHYQRFGCEEHRSVALTSAVDPTVRFIGSHTSVLKQYIISGKIPSLGFCINQTCLKNKNLQVFDDDTLCPQFGSIFLCQGVLVPYDQFASIAAHTFDYLFQWQNLNHSDVRVWVSSTDNDLVDVLALCHVEQLIQFDTLPVNKYRHCFGMDNIAGRNFNIALRHKKTQDWSYAIVIIVIEKDGIPKFVEVAISPALIITQILGLPHVLDCYPFPTVQYRCEKLRRKFEDCIIVIIHLYKEGLRPSNKHNRNRILKKYMFYADSFRKIIGLDRKRLEKTIQKFEEMHFFTASSVSEVIVDDIIKLAETDIKAPNIES